MATIRPAQPDDASTIAEIGFESWQRSEFGTNDAGRADRDYLFSEFLGFAQEHWPTIRVATEAEKVSAWGAREFRNQVITDLWVSSSSQRQGLGKLLLSHLESEISDAGFEFAELETLATNAQALGFYRAQGFVVTSSFLKY